MNDDLDSAKLARIEQKVVNIDEWRVAHDRHDEQRFERIFGYIKDGFDKIDERFDKLDNKQNTLWDERNQATGGFKATKLLGGSLWALLAIGISWVLNGSHKP